MLERLIDKLPALQYTGYLLVFVAALLEALPVVGLVIPGQAVLVVAGFLAARGVLHWWLVALIAMAGAVLGDAISYWLGKRYKLSFLGKHQQMLSDVLSLLRAHPFKTLVLGRFNSLTRSFAPYAAGANQLSTKRFMLANVVGGALWAFCWTGVGMLLGAGYGYATKTLETTVLIAVVLAAGLFFLFRYLRRKYGLGHVAFGLATISVLTLVAFGILVSSLRDPSLLALDALGQTLTLGAHTPVATATALLFTALIHPLTLTFITVVTGSGLYFANKRRAAALFLLAVGGALIIAFMVKGIVVRVRPPTVLAWDVTTGSQGFSSWSFPSGHALLAVSVFGSIALAMRRLVPFYRTVAVFCMLVATAVCASRVALGVHWASDVLAGAVLGLFWISFLYVVDEAARARDAAVRFSKREKPRKNSKSAV